MRESKTFDFGYAKVTVHPGNLSEEDFKKTIENAARHFVTAIEKRQPGYFRRRSSASPKAELRSTPIMPLDQQ